MKCPKCNNTMQEITQDNVTFNKCGSCYGLWFEDENLLSAKNIKGFAEKIDNDKTNAGSMFNDTRDISCPECSQKMIKMTDKDQLHIKYELCHYCHGVFFDSGEFKDLSDFSLAEKVRQTIQTLSKNLSA